MRQLGSPLCFFMPRAEVSYRDAQPVARSLIVVIAPKLERRFQLERRKTFVVPGVVHRLAPQWGTCRTVTPRLLIFRSPVEVG